MSLIIRRMERFDSNPNGVVKTLVRIFIEYRLIQSLELTSDCVCRRLLENP